jgi:hypothetical protein
VLSQLVLVNQIVQTKAYKQPLGVFFQGFCASWLWNPHQSTHVTTNNMGVFIPLVFFYHISTDKNQMAQYHDYDT